MLHAGQAGRPDLGLILVSPGGPQRVLVEWAPTVGEMAAEASDSHREQLPPRQPRPPVDTEDTAVGEVVADGGDKQRTEQRDDPSPVEVTENRAHLAEADHVRQARPGGQIQDRGGHGEQDRNSRPPLEIVGRQDPRDPRPRHAHDAYVCPRARRPISLPASPDPHRGPDVCGWPAG